MNRHWWCLSSSVPVHIIYLFGDFFVAGSVFQWCTLREKGWPKLILTLPSGFFQKTDKSCINTDLKPTCLNIWHLQSLRRHNSFTFRRDMSISKTPMNKMYERQKDKQPVPECICVCMNAGTVCSVICVPCLNDRTKWWGEDLIIAINREQHPLYSKVSKSK